MRWHDLLSGVAVLATAGANPEIAAVEYDSRAVRPGALFVAMRGESTDGNRYLQSALEGGAAAVVTDSRESFAFAEARGLPVALVEHGRRALAGVSANFYGHPERALALTAVTGTNGKTTTAFLTEALLRSAGRRSVLMGTIETHVAGEVRTSTHTTPESRDILAIVADGVRAGATEAVMEMSSHALDQERVWGLPVDTAIFTNLTQDHLDYHGSMERYAAAKARLFHGVGAPPPRVAILNADDAALPLFMSAARGCGTVWTYSLDDPGADFHAHAVQAGSGMLRFQLRSPLGETEVQAPLTGRVNAYNLLAAMAAAVARGLALRQVVESAATLQAVPGRFQAVPNALGMHVIVDYAHTDDALRSLLSLARSLAGHGRIVTVFGCGGDRDKTKRPKMGRAAAEGSDLVIVTSDNPRSEDPATIAAEALAGVRAANRAESLVILERAEAIAEAIRRAGAGDIVLIAGKGHEKTQTGRDGVIAFDDVAVAGEILRSEGAKR